MRESNITSTQLKVAVLGDIHVGEDLEAVTAFRQLVLEIKKADPDLILFTGDYVESPRTIFNLSTHRKRIVKIIEQTNPIPRLVVLGNYETWSDADKWHEEFERLDVDVLENEVRVLRTRGGVICVRGFGDNYTGRYRYVDFPRQCDDKPKLTMTHDPAAAFKENVHGLVVAGHTHCGQIKLPLVGILWVPTEAPARGICGLYTDQDRTVFVTSGVGTSIMPIRLGAQSQWDFITIRFGT
jgi:predicted MPP superfamily phosphohydrolase